jgi:hypothetical protein
LKQAVSRTNKTSSGRSPNAVKSLLILLFALLALFSADAQETNALPHLEPVPPLTDLRTVAKTNDIPLDGIGPLKGTNVLQGDSLTTLITLHQKRGRLTQWLVYFQVIAISNEPPSRAANPIVLYNSAGDEFQFSNIPVTFRIRTIGPYVESASVWGAPVPKDDDARASVNGTFLALGLDRCMAALYRLDPLIRNTGTTNFHLRIAEKPFPDATVKKAQKLVALFQITPQERIAMATAEPTMTSYFNAVGETPGLDGILWKVVSLPSVWSIVKHRGISARLNFDMHGIRPISLPPAWNLPGHAPIYALPLSLILNEKPALNVTLIITSPNPSLVACGGIVGFVAQNPDDQQDYLTLRVISARNGTASKR